jgi:hypothetical protein
MYHSSLYRIYLNLTKEQSIEGKNGVVNQIKDATVAKAYSALPTTSY